MYKEISDFVFFESLRDSFVTMAPKPTKSEKNGMKDKVKSGRKKAIRV